MSKPAIYFEREHPKVMFSVKQYGPLSAYIVRWTAVYFEMNHAVQSIIINCNVPPLNY